LGRDRRKDDRAQDETRNYAFERFHGGFSTREEGESLTTDYTDY
jgi:hypothetical protein